MITFNFLMQTTKVFVKNSLKYVPIFGWAWVFTESIFLKRSWEKDRKIISRDLQFLHEYPPGYNITVSREYKCFSRC